VQQVRFSILLGGLTAAKSIESSLQGNKLMHLLVQIPCLLPLASYNGSKIFKTVNLETS